MQAWVGSRCPALISRVRVLAGPAAYATASPRQLRSGTVPSWSPGTNRTVPVACRLIWTIAGASMLHGWGGQHRLRASIIARFGQCLVASCGLAHLGHGSFSRRMSRGPRDRMRLGLVRRCEWLPGPDIQAVRLDTLIDGTGNARHKRRWAAPAMAWIRWIAPPPPGSKMFVGNFRSCVRIAGNMPGCRDRASATSTKASRRSGGATRAATGIFSAS